MRHLAAFDKGILILAGPMQDVGGTYSVYRWEPLYSILDALHSFDHFGRTAVYDEPIELAAGVRATFISAGPGP